MAEEAVSFDQALEALAAALAQEQPTARRALDGPRVRPGQLPDIGQMPPRREARSAQPVMPSMASSPLDYFRASGERMASMTPEDQMNALGRGAGTAAELTGVPGLVRAGDAVGDAMIDPSIPSVANAGAKTAMALGRPLAALGALGGGFAGSVAKDLGAFDDGAQAQERLPRDQRRALEAERQRAERDAAIAERKAAQDSKLRQEEDAAKQRRDLDAEATRGGREAFNRQVKTAEDARDKELARDKRFADTSTGKFYETTAGYTPAVIAAATGFLTRGAMKPSLLSNYGLPIGVGAAEGLVAANAPLGTDAYLLPPASNPTRAAYEAYARELPPDHPRRQEWMDYARSLPEANPVRENSSKELYDPVKLAERSGLGVVEGGAGGFGGAKGFSLLARGANALADAPGKVRAFLRSPQADPSTMPAPLAGTAVEANALSRPTTSGSMSSAGTLPASEGVALNGLSAPAQRQLPAPEAVPNQPAPEPRVIMKVKGKDGRTRVHDGDTGYFTSDPRKKD